MDIPYIGLCGWPKAGKTEVAQILEAAFGVTIVDDGRPLRDAAKILYPVTEWHVTTQEGKASFVEVCGQQIQVRQLLGDLGQMLEDRYGEQVVPEMALRMVEQLRGDRADARFCFPSVRKTQGITYRKAGGIIVEVVRPGVQASPYAFDRYDPTLVDLRIVNPAPLHFPADQADRWRRELHQAAIDAFEKVLG